MGSFDRIQRKWRTVVLWAFPLLSLLGMLLLPPIPQDPAYHAFADNRTFIGIPNFADVVSSLPFLIVGIAGIRSALRARVGPARPAWVALFIGTALVSLGSGYYHWSPDNGSLFWDRLPMTAGFMGLLVALLGEYVDPRLTGRLLAPAILAGTAAVLYWRFADDLRFYAWIQFMPLGVVVLLVLLFPPRFTHSWLLLAALGWYALAKTCEQFDAVLFDASGAWISGHTLKHLSAAAACWMLVCWLGVRRPRD